MEIDELQKLCFAIEDNRDRCFVYLQRLYRVHGYTVSFPSDGKPKPVKDLPAAGLVWTLIQPKDEKPRPYPARAVLEDWKALCTQGVRLRQAFLSEFPNESLRMLFPLNLMI